MLFKSSKYKTSPHTTSKSLTYQTSKTWTSSVTKWERRSIRSSSRGGRKLERRKHWRLDGRRIWSFWWGIEVWRICGCFFLYVFICWGGMLSFFLNSFQGYPHRTFRNTNQRDPGGDRKPYRTRRRRPRSQSHSRPIRIWFRRCARRRRLWRSQRH